MSEPKWEHVQSSDNRYTTRLSVPGGWLYCVIERTEFGGIINQMLAFVPKPASSK
jgi:hypothetical protein